MLALCIHNDNGIKCCHRYFYWWWRESVWWCLLWMIVEGGAVVSCQHHKGTELFQFQEIKYWHSIHYFPLFSSQLFLIKWVSIFYLSLSQQWPGSTKARPPGCKPWPITTPGPGGLRTSAVFREELCIDCIHLTNIYIDKVLTSSLSSPTSIFKDQFSSLWSDLWSELCLSLWGILTQI